MHNLVAFVLFLQNWLSEKKKRLQNINNINNSNKKVLVKSGANWNKSRVKLVLMVQTG